MQVKRVTKPKRWRYPEASERLLSRSLSGVVADLVSHMRDKVKPMKFDATDEEIQSAEEETRSYGYLLLAALLLRLPSIALTIYRFNSDQWVEVARAAGGMRKGKENPAVAMLILLGANGGEPWYQEKYNLWRSQTEASYRKLIDDIVSDWSKNLRSASASDKSKSAVNDMAERRYRVYTTTAANRASGIVGSWNSMLMRQRIKDSGVTHFIWQGWLDERERVKHILFEGKRIGVSTDHVWPGEEYGCRCWCTPDFDN